MSGNGRLRSQLGKQNIYQEVFDKNSLKVTSENGLTVTQLVNLVVTLCMSGHLTLHKRNYYF